MIARMVLGETVGIKLANIFKIGALVCAGVCLGLAGCGGSAANVIVVGVSPSGDTLVVNQALTFTATVTGATNLNVTWSCTFTTTTTPTGSTTPVTSAAAPCTAAQGVLSDVQDTTVTYTAPA